MLPFNKVVRLSHFELGYSLSLSETIFKKDFLVAKLSCRYIGSQSAKYGRYLVENWFSLLRDCKICNGVSPLCKKNEIYERFLENKIELIPMFPLI